MNNFKTFFGALLLISVSSFGQNQEKKKSDSENSVNIKINANTPKIYLLGGIISVVTKADLEFGEKYNILFQDFGCVVPTNIDFYEEQNQKVFNNLNKKYGTDWQKEIKQSTLGFKKWKENNK